MSRLVQRLRAYRRYRNTVEQLSKLSDRQLADIGLVRYQIEEKARG